MTDAPQKEIGHYTLEIWGSMKAKRKVFAEGREKGLVEVHAVTVVAGQIAVTVWFQNMRTKRCRAGIEE